MVPRADVERIARIDAERGQARRLIDTATYEADETSEALDEAGGYQLA